MVPAGLEEQVKAELRASRAQAEATIAGLSRADLEALTVLAFEHLIGWELYAAKLVEIGVLGRVTGN